MGDGKREVTRDVEPGESGESGEWRRPSGSSGSGESGEWRRPSDPRVPRPGSVRDEASGGRPVALARSSASHEVGARVKILFVAANAGAREQLALDIEYRAIEESIRAARYRDAFQLIPKLAARPADLQQALLEHSPDVVHFACHGTAEAELVLVEDSAGSGRIPAGALASTFRVLRDNVSLVVFNACFAGEQAEAIRRSAGIAIGVRAQIADAAAIAFASALYNALAHGRSVRDAYELGVAAIQAAAPGQQELPELFEEPGLDAGAVCLIEGRDSRGMGAADAAGTRWRRLVRGAAILGVLLALALAWWLLRAAGQRETPLPPPGLGMVRIAGGPIRLGVFDLSRRPDLCASLTAAEDAAVLEHPEQVAEVRLAPFDLDEREVTHHQLAEWLNTRVKEWEASAQGVITTRQQAALPLALASEACGSGLALSEDGRVHVGADKASWPAVCVTWHGASEYCRAQGKRLPLEAEWELAAKGASGRPFPWGADLPRHDGVTFDLRDGMAAHPRAVGTSPQDVSPEGAHDLGGSVAEWVEDGRGLADEKTIRGGGWASRGPCRLLASGRKRLPAGRFAKDVGFRCARSVIATREAK